MAILSSSEPLCPSVRVAEHSYKIGALRLEGRSPSWMENKAQYFLVFYTFLLTSLFFLLCQVAWFTDPRLCLVALGFPGSSHNRPWAPSRRDDQTHLSGRWGLTHPATRTLGREPIRPRWTSG